MTTPDKPYTDLVLTRSTSTGTGDLTLDSLRDKGWRHPADAFNNPGQNERFVYFIRNQSAQEWEIGLGHITGFFANKLVRDTVKASSNGGNLVDFSKGQKLVSVDKAADMEVDKHPERNVSIADGDTYTVNHGLGDPPYHISLIDRDLLDNSSEYQDIKDQLTIQNMQTDSFEILNQTGSSVTLDVFVTA